MKINTQRTYSCHVERQSDRETLCSAYCMDKGFEGVAEISFLNDSYLITDARWAIHRCGYPARIGEGSAPLLIGDSAYPRDGRNHVKALPDYSAGQDAVSEGLNSDDGSEVWEQVRELFRETLRGALQAETYLYRERGYEDPYVYEESWHSDCRPYALDPPSTHAWPEYILSDSYCRARNLYNKYLHCAIMECGAETLTCIGSYCDSFHEMSVTMEISAVESKITGLSFLPSRVPFPRCHDFDESFAAGLMGRCAGSLKKKDIAAVLGGPTGCFHYVDIVTELCRLAGDMIPIDQ